MTVDQWITHPAQLARATRRIYDANGCFASRGSMGEVCDYLPGDGYVVVDFPDTGAVLCWPDEIAPALIRPS